MLSSCSSKPVKTKISTSWQSRQAILAEIDQWQLHARIGLRSKHRSGSASLIWDEIPGQRNLRLLGPVGGGLILLQQDSTGVTLTDSKGKTWYATDASELIQRVTGWQIPVSGLRWWLLGMTEPGSKAAYTLDQSQRLASINQDQWKVAFDKYSMFGRYELPTSIIIESDSSKDDDKYIRAKLIVKNWNFEIKEGR